MDDLSHAIGRRRVGRNRPCPSQLLAQIGHLLAKSVALGVPIGWHVGMPHHPEADEHRRRAGGSWQHG